MQRCAIPWIGTSVLLLPQVRRSSGLNARLALKHRCNWGGGKGMTSLWIIIGLNCREFM